MTQAAQTGAATGLRRSLRPIGVLALTLAALSPAASVYVTGAAVLRLAGSGAAAAMLAGGAVTMIATLLYAELGSAYPHAGGVYHGLGAVLGPRAGAAGLALGLVTAPALVAFAALGLADYLRALAPGLPLEGIALTAIGIAVVTALLRLRAGLWLTAVLLVAELAALLALIVLEWAHPARGLGTVLHHPVTAGPHGSLVATGAVPLILATIAASYACSGSSLALNFAEEVKGDERRIGRIVVIGGVLSVALVALPIIGVTVGTPDLAATLSAEAPIAASLRAIAGAAAADILVAVVALAILDHVAGAVIAYSRMVFAAARTLDGTRAPVAALAQVGAQSGAPAAAALVLGAAAMLLTLLGERGLLLLVSGELLTPAMVVAAVLVMRRRKPADAPGFRASTYPALAYLGVAVLLVFVVTDLLDPTARRSLLLLTLVAIAAAFSGRRLTNAR